VGLIGNHRLEVLPVWELLFDKKPADVPLIATARAKWNLKYQKKWGVVSQEAENLPNGLAARITGRCKTIYRLLRQSGYARLDFRLNGDGQLYFLECNPNPALSRDEDFAMSALKRSDNYPGLVQRIVNLGMRWAEESPGSRLRGIPHDDRKRLA
jgi:D-alanine-D-alanine ligase